MLKKSVTVCLVILSFFGCAMASDVQWIGSISQLWDVNENWDLGHVPQITDRAILNNTPGPIIDANTNASVNTVKIGGTGGELFVNGGSLTTSGSRARIDIGFDAGTSGTLTINDGNVTSGSDLFVGYNGNGTINMNGGVLNINGTLGIAYNSDTIAGYVYLYVGTINCNDLVMAPYYGIAVIDITNGKLILNGDKTSTINSYVNITGWITAYGGAGLVIYDYNITNPGKTTVIGSRIANNPDPYNGKTNVAINQVLHWNAIPGASNDLYFGTNADDVNNASYMAASLQGDLDGDGLVDYNDLIILANYWLLDPTGSVPYAGVNNDNIVDFVDFALMANNWMASTGPNPLYMGKFDVNYFTPAIAVNTTYYWRVDENFAGEICKGNLWSFTTVDGNYSLIGKVMCGYQGWFNCSGDGANQGWFHWPRSGSSAPTPTNVNVDLWPETNEMNASEMFAATSFNDGNGTHYLFSSHNSTTVLRHFQWMQQYGIDGIYLQRFATEVKDHGSTTFLNRNDILGYCKTAANMYGRKYAIMYDLTGLGAGEASYVINDWKYLVDTKHLIEDPNYMHHRGKPVVAVWGIGFNDGNRKYTLAECLTLVDFLRNDPVYGGNKVVVGVPSYWRDHDGTHDCVNDPCVATIVKVADIVSPWSVGRPTNTNDVISYASYIWVKDIQWCEQNSTPDHPIEYLPVIFPGYSHHNATANKNPPQVVNQIPRWGGQFYWDMVYYSTHVANCNMLYVAMFDECDEGTAVLKVSNTPPTGASFVSYRQDLAGQGVGTLPAGAPLANDEYLWLTGQAGMALRGEIPQTSTRPARP